MIKKIIMSRLATRELMSRINWQPLKRGSNVAVVFKDQLPKTWMSRKVIDVDLHDLRFKDPSGVIVGLVAKGLGRKDLNNSFIKIAS